MLQTNSFDRLALHWLFNVAAQGLKGKIKTKAEIPQHISQSMTFRIKLLQLLCTDTGHQKQQNPGDCDILQTFFLSRRHPVNTWRRLAGI